MKSTIVAAGVLTATLIGAFAGSAAQADPQGGKPGYGQTHMGPGHHGYGQGYGAGRHHGHGMHHGGGGGHHGMGMGHHEAGKHWMASLSPEQHQQVMQLRAEHKKQAMPRKARMRAIKLELAALATAVAPDRAAIETKVDEFLALKRLAMIERAMHVGDLRRLLNDEQKAAYDMAVMRKARGWRHRRH